MSFYLGLPLLFVKFWFYEAPREILAFCGSLNHAFLQLFSLPLLVKTFFRPIKNEYREGLIWFSIGMGMFIKTFIIAVDLLLLLLLLMSELIIIAGFVLWPVVAVALLFL